MKGLLLLSNNLKILHEKQSAFNLWNRNPESNFKNPLAIIQSSRSIDCELLERLFVVNENSSGLLMMTRGLGL